MVVLLERRQYLVAQYSAGVPIPIVAGTFQRVVADIARYVAIWDEQRSLRVFDAYVETLWLVAWAILFDSSDTAFDQVLTMIETKHRDRLLDRLIALRRPDWPLSDTLLHARPYRKLLHAIEADGHEREVGIMQFLDHYYKGMRRAYWHDLHVVQPGNFFGYWCFELAAFVKVLRIPDQSFADNIYYPRDLVTHSPARDE